MLEPQFDPGVFVTAFTVADLTQHAESSAILDWGAVAVSSRANMPEQNGYSVLSQGETPRAAYDTAYQCALLNIQGKVNRISVDTHLACAHYPN